MVKITYTGDYQEDLLNLLETFPELKQEVDRRVFWFQKNSDDTRLDIHPLRKSMEGKWAFSITDNIRIVYEWSGKKTVRFLAIGSHTQVYKISVIKEKN